LILAIFNPGPLDPYIISLESMSRQTPDLSSSNIPGLYIHLPFCRTKCPYCAFYSETDLSFIPDFLRALFQEMDMARNQFDRFDTVYIGGGTPSVFTSYQTEEILKRIRHNFTLAAHAEITLEANPADINISFLERLRDMGVNRLNLGIQSFDRKILNFLGRRHSSAQAISAIEISRKAGFTNLGFDLIYSVPGQDMKAWLDTLSQGVAFAPEHLSCYQLTVEANTPLLTRYQKGELPFLTEGLQYDFFIKTSEQLEDAGYAHYEVSNFSRGIEYASRHNQKYWDHTPYLGLGPSAHSFSGNRRWWNHRNLEDYINELSLRNAPIQAAETLSPEQLRLEALFLALRTSAGLHLKDFSEKFQYDLLLEKGETLAKLQEEGRVTIRDGILYPTRSGLAIADSLALI